MVRILAKQIELRALSDLTPYANNARTHSETQVAQIAAAITEFGFTNPVLINEHGGLIAGHGRVLAASLLGMQEVPCITLAGLSDVQRRAYVLADNKLALNAGWDEELLRLELSELTEAGFDLDFIGFSEKEVTELMIDETAGNIEEGEIPIPEAVPFSQPGDTWILGPHCVHCGDSTDAQAFAGLMGGVMADMVFTDPPYGVDYADIVDARNRAGIGGKAVKHKPIANDAKSDADQLAFWLAAFQQLAANIKPGASYYVASPQGGRMMMMMQAMTDAGIPQRHEIIWRKNSFVLGRSDYHYQHEPILYGWREGAAHAFYGGRTQTSVWDVNRPQKADLHPTMKPVELMVIAINNSSKSGDIVLDIFGGSGSTLIACESTGRHCRMIELDPGYIDVIVRRWQNLTGLQAYRESDGATLPESATHQ